jgi:hypothetical protein
MRGAIQLGDRVHAQDVTLDQPRAEARQRRLTDPHRAARAIGLRHVAHSPVDRFHVHVANARHPALVFAHEP